MNQFKYSLYSQEKKKEIFNVSMLRIAYLKGKNRNRNCINDPAAEKLKVVLIS